ncbi:hypothetical protein [Microcystis phage Mel-JY01]
MPKPIKEIILKEQIIKYISNEKRGIIDIHNEDIQPPQYESWKRYIHSLINYLFEYDLNVIGTLAQCESIERVVINNKILFVRSNECQTVMHYIEIHCNDSTRLNPVAVSKPRLTGQIYIDMDDSIIKIISTEIDEWS